MAPNATLAASIEHTLLTSTASVESIERLCEEATAESFLGVCVHPVHVPRCVARLSMSPCAVITVVGFPLGLSTSESKAFETAAAVAQGAREVDMVLRVDALKQGDARTVVADVSAVVAAAGACAVKVILETGLLTADEIGLACSLCAEAGARFVKTSTGFGPRGASVEDVRLMRAAVGEEMGIKASGGIRTREQALALLAAGADRIGTSNGVAIVRGPCVPIVRGP